MAKVGIKHPIGSGGSGGGTTTTNVTIPELTSDPASPTAESAWVRYTAATGGGSPIGLLLALTTAATGAELYELSYKTLEGTIVRVELT